MSSVSASIESSPLSAISLPTRPSPVPLTPVEAEASRHLAIARTATGLGGGKHGSAPETHASLRALPGSGLPGLRGALECRTEGLACGTNGSKRSGGRGTGVRGGHASGGIRGGGFRLGFAPLGSTKGLGGGSIAGEHDPALWRGTLAEGSVEVASPIALLVTLWGSVEHTGSAGLPTRRSLAVLRGLFAPPRLRRRRVRPKPDATKPAFPPTVSMKEDDPTTGALGLCRKPALGPKGHLRTAEVFPGPPQTAP